MLPLATAGLRRGVAVVGPNANDSTIMLGNYNGLPPHIITPLDGIRSLVGAAATVR